MVNKNTLGRALLALALGRVDQEAGAGRGQ